MNSKTKANATEDWIISLRRYSYMAGGILCVVLAAIGAVVPGMPTVIFLLAASFLFTRSFPQLEQRLIRNRFFAPFHGYLDGTVVMPLRVRIVSIIGMWASITLSVLAQRWNDQPTWIAWTIIAAGFVGTVFIWRFRRTIKQLKH